MLPNGLQLILHVDRKLPIVHVNQWFHVGSKNEKPGRTGFAHLFEHMMFQGSKNVPGEYFTSIEKMGANLQEGGVNGTTNNDRTNYFATVPSANLETLLWVESDRLATLLDETDQKKLDNQRDVVKNERRQGFENQPYGRGLRDPRRRTLPPAGHPYSWPVIGSMEDLTRRVARRREGVLPPLLHAEQPVARHRRRLRSGRGEAAGREVLRRPAARTGARSAAALDARSSNGERVVEVADRVPQERTYIVCAAPEYFGADDAAMQIAVADPRRRPVVAARTRRSSTTSRWRSEVNVASTPQEIAGGFVVIGDGARRRRARRTSSRSSREEMHLLARDRARPRPSSIAPGRSRSSSSSRGSSASAASAARPIC